MPAQIPLDALTVFLDEYKVLTDQMDQAYDRAAEANGFVCNGCRESCCETLFYHHTYLEYYLIQEGIKSMVPPVREKIIATAADVCRKTKTTEAQKAPYRIMCPLNYEGKCGLYAFRPMICRMHGIAHLMIRPDGTKLEGPGCHQFERRYTNTNTIKVRFDRTPFYRKMAELEKRLRVTFGLQNKLKLTIAQMILAAAPDE